MDANEHTDLINSLFPIGEERWLKVKYTDLDWCKKNLRLGRTVQPDPPLGFELLSITVRPDYEPQVSALLEIKDVVASQLVHTVPDYVIENIKALIDQKIREINKQTIFNGQW